MAQQQLITRYGFLILAVGSVLVMGVVTALSVRSVLVDIESKAEERFDAEVSDALSDIELHYRGIETTLRAMRGFFSGSEEVTREEFHEFIRSSHIRETYPGFSTLAYIARVVQEDGESWPIVYIDPENSAGGLVGMDQFAEADRRRNIEVARDSGELHVSSIISLLPKEKPGVIIVVPLYKKGTYPYTVEMRREVFDGALSSALYLDEFLEQILPKQSLMQTGIGFHIALAGDENFIYDEPSQETKLLDRFFTPLELRFPWTFGGEGGELIFEAPASAMLTQAERLEPFAVILFFVFFTLFILFVLFTARSLQRISSFKERYALVSLLSHQLRTPVTKLRWTIESALAQRRPKTSDLKALEVHTTSLAGIIQKLLLFTKEKPVNKVTRKKPRSVPVSRIVSKALQQLPKTFDLKRVNLLPAPSGLMVQVRDEPAIVLTLHDLLNNALTYSPQTSDVRLGITEEGGKVLFSVEDDGYGIPRTEQKDVFRTFFRASNASLGKNEGSGVSLYLAETNVKRNDGSISFKSTEGTGSTFTIELPKAK